MSLIVVVKNNTLSSRFSHLRCLQAYYVPSIQELGNYLSDAHKNFISTNAQQDISQEINTDPLNYQHVSMILSREAQKYDIILYP